MARNDQELLKQCDALFATLNRSYLNQLAFCLSWSIDDLRQEFRLVFWEINLGTRDFDALKGDIAGYFIGRLRNKIHRNITLNFAVPMNCSDFDEDVPYQNNSIQSIQEKSVLDLLVERENQVEAENIAQEIENNIENLRIHFGSRKKGKQDWVWRLWHQGLSQMQIARVGGVSQSYVSRTLNKKPAIKTTIRMRKNRAIAINMDQGVLF